MWKRCGKICDVNVAHRPHLRFADEKGAHRSVALAAWLARFLNEFGVPAVFFTPSLDDDWKMTMLNIFKFATRPP